MVVLGHDSTVPATVDEMLVLTRAVTRGAKRPLVVADLPFGSFQVSDADAVSNAMRFVKEARRRRREARGRRATLSRVARDRRRRDPGDGSHRPDTAVGDDARRVQGAGPDAPSKARQLFDDALALEAAGCFSLVLEAVPAAVAARITRRSPIPTIGIGAGAACDGQVLV